MMCSFTLDTFLTFDREAFVVVSLARGTGDPSIRR
jgi:hypothetical protein